MQRPHRKPTSPILAQAIEAEIDALKKLMASDDEMRRAKRQLAADLILCPRQPAKHGQYIR